MLWLFYVGYFGNDGGGDWSYFFSKGNIVIKKFILKYNKLVYIFLEMFYYFLKLFRSGNFLLYWGYLFFLI